MSGSSSRSAAAASPYSSYAWTEHYNVNRSYTPDGLNRYGSIATVGGSTITPTYDGRNNMTSAGATTYGYTSENLLTSASGGVTLAYDPLTRLYQTSNGVTTTRFAYDGAAMIAEYNAANTLQRRFVHGPGVDEPIVWYEGTGTSDRRWLHADERGSIVAISDTFGTVVVANTYNEYGIPAPGNVGRFGYTGQAWLPELGMWYYRARIYSPTLGRFMQTDPIGYGDGMNLYAYVGNNPVNATDPSGLWGGSCITTGSHICQPKNYICSSCSGSSTGGFGGRAPGGESGGGSGSGAGSAASYGGTVKNTPIIRTYFSDDTTKDSTGQSFLTNAGGGFGFWDLGAQFQLAGQGLLNPMVLVEPLSPARYAHIAGSHFGDSKLNRSVFAPAFRSEAALNMLAAYAVVNSVPINGPVPGSNYFTISFSRTIGWDRSIGMDTSIYTVATYDTLRRTEQGIRILGIANIYPGNPF